MAELAKRIGATGDLPGLLDAAAKTGVSHGPTQTKVLAQLVGQAAGSILEYAVALGLPPKQTLPVLVTAPDLTFRPCDVADALGESVERADGGPDRRSTAQDAADRAGEISPLDVLADSGGGAYLDMAHHTLVNDDALRHWAYEDHDPKTLLWLCAGSVEGTRDGSRHVQAERADSLGACASANVPDDQVLRFVLACKDPKIARYVHEHVLIEHPIMVDADYNTAQPIALETYGKGDRARLDVAVVAGTDAKTVSKSDLTPSEQLEVANDPGRLAQALGALAGHDLSRAVHVLGPTIPQLLGAVAGSAPQLLSYVRTRPANEEQAVVNHPKLTDAARRILGASPFVVFPGLIQTAILAAALDPNPSIIDWILDTTDAGFALTLLAREDPHDKKRRRSSQLGPSCTTGCRSSGICCRPARLDYGSSRRGFRTTNSARPRRTTPREPRPRRPRRRVTAKSFTMPRRRATCGLPSTT